MPTIPVYSSQLFTLTDSSCQLFTIVGQLCYNYIMNAYTIDLSLQVWDRIASMCYPTENSKLTMEPLMRFIPELDRGPKHLTFLLPHPAPPWCRNNTMIILTLNEHNQLHSYDNVPAYYYKHISPINEKFHLETEYYVQYKEGMRHSIVGPAWYVETPSTSKHHWFVRDELLTDAKSFKQSLLEEEKEDGTMAILKWGENTIYEID